MPNSSHLTEYAGLPVVEFTGWEALRTEFHIAMSWASNRRERHPDLPSSYEPLFAAIAAPGSVAWRLRAEEPGYHQRTAQTLSEYLDEFERLVPRDEVRALVVGHVEDEARVTGNLLDELVGRVFAYTGLRSLFFGDVTREENEISWIEHGDLGPLLTALPYLTAFTVRGGSAGLDLTITEPHGLRSLTVQSGGLRPEVVRTVCAAPLPEVEHLELWLGAEEYAGEHTTEADLAPLLSGTAFPKLRSLGLRNAENADDCVAALAEAPVTGSLTELDLSLGALTDRGARILLDTPVFHGLRRLDLHHHYLSEEMADRLGAALTASGVEHDLSGRLEPEENPYADGGLSYYTAVSE